MKTSDVGLTLPICCTGFGILENAFRAAYTVLLTVNNNNRQINQKLADRRKNIKPTAGREN